MNDKNLQLFFSGLDSVLENGWIQSLSSSFQIPDGWGISVFTSKTIVLSFNHVLLYSIKNCHKEAFKKVIKHLGDVEFLNVWPIYKEWESNKKYGLKQLESYQIYDALSVLNSDNSNVLLSQINCTVGTYTELKDALAKKDKDRFINAISDCNTSCINMVLANILFLLKSDSYYKMHKNYHCDCCDNDKHISNTGKKTFEKKDIAIGNGFLENLNNTINTAIKAEVFATTNVILKLIEGPRYSNKYIPSNDVLLDSVYYSYFFQYCRLRDENALDTKAEYAYKFIFRLPAVKEKYNEGMEYWKNNCWEEKLKEYGLKIRNLLFVEHAKVIDNSQQTSQIEEPAAEEMMDVPGRSRNTLDKRRGRHKDSWIKGRSQIKEEDVGDLIQKRIWKSLIESVKKLKFKKGIEGITKEKQVKNFSAGLLYYALEAIGWAKVYTTSGVQSSFERTMRFAGIARTSFEKNIRYIHEWYNLADEYKGHPNQFDDCYSTCKEKDPHMAVLIFENVNEVGKIIDDLKIKLKKTLDENCKL